MIEIVPLASLIIPATMILHEILHFLAAVNLGYSSRIELKRIGLAVIIDEFKDYFSFSDIKDKHRKRDYFIIASMPYILLPLYTVMLFNISQPLLRGILKIIILYNIFSYPLEFYQERILFIASSLTMTVAVMLAL